MKRYEITVIIGDYLSEMSADQAAETAREILLGNSITITRPGRCRHLIAKRVVSAVKTPPLLAGLRMCELLDEAGLSDNGIDSAQHLTLHVLPVTS